MCMSMSSSTVAIPPATTQRAQPGTLRPNRFDCRSASLNHSMPSSSCNSRTASPDASPTSGSVSQSALAALVPM